MAIKFKISHLEYSSIAIRLGIKNKISPFLYEYVDNFINKLVQPLYDNIYEFEMVESGGFRTEFLNNQIGGQLHSKHMYSDLGLAIDVRPKNLTKVDFVNKIISSGLPFDEIKLEYWKTFKNGWVEISFSPLLNTPKKIVFVRESGIMNTKINKYNDYGIVL
jgi:hypothetical protein